MVRAHVAAALLAASTSASAAAQEATLRLDTPRVEVGQAVGATLTVRGFAPWSLPTFPEPPGVSIEFVGQTQSITAVQGRTSREVSYSFQIAARRPGQVQLGPITARDTQGREITSNIVTLDVRPADPTSAASAQEVEVAVSFTPERAWEGQVVVVSHRLRSRRQVLGGNWLGLPEDHLALTRDGDPQRREYELREADGVLFVDENWRAMVPTSTGTLTWEPVSVQLEVARPRARRAFDPIGVFFQERERVVAMTGPLTLEVQPRPAPPGPWSGAVGDFTAEVRVSDARARVGDSVRWTLEVTGDGALDTLQIPGLGPLDGAQVYDGTPQARAVLKDGAYQAWSTLERTIVPTRTGSLTLPDLALVTFSPSLGRYVTLPLRGATIEVSPGEHGELSLKDHTAALPEAAPTVEEDAPPTTGSGGRLPWLRLLPALWALTGAPALGIALLAFRDALSVWRHARAAEAARAPAGPLDLLADLPGRADALEEPRLARLDEALRLALPDATEGSATAEDLLERAALIRALDLARFAGQTPLPDLEARVVALIRKVVAGPRRPR